MHVYVKSSNDHVVGRVVWSLDQDVLIGISEHEMLEADCSKLQGGSLEKATDHRVSLEVVTLAFKAERGHRRMMRHLLCHKAEIGLKDLVGLSKDRVEGFSVSLVYFGVLREKGDANHAKSLVVIFLFL